MPPPTKLVAVTMPAKVASPSELNVAPVPICTSAPVKVTIPVNVASPSGLNVIPVPTNTSGPLK